MKQFHNSISIFRKSKYISRNCNACDLSVIALLTQFTFHKLSHKMKNVSTVTVQCSRIFMKSSPSFLFLFFSVILIFILKREIICGAISFSNMNCICNDDRNIHIVYFICFAIFFFFVSNAIHRQIVLNKF